MEARKLPAAPALSDTISMRIEDRSQANISTYMTKSIPPSSLTQRSTASCKFSSLRTSTEPIPITLAPGRAVAMSWATRSVFSTLRPMMQALAPRCTKARTWALQIVPAPPVQKTTLFAGSRNQRGCGVDGLEESLPKIPSFQESLKYSVLGSGILVTMYVPG